MSRKAPAFQLYVDDFLAGTIGMSAEEVGVYIRLLCVQWSCGVVTDRHARATLGSKESIQYVLKEKFETVEGGYRNARLERVRQATEERKQNASKGGSNTQAKRKANEQVNTEADDEQNGKQAGVVKVNPPTPTPTPTPDSSSQSISISNSDLHATHASTAAAASGPSKADCQGVLDYWNLKFDEKCILTEKRLAKCKQRLREKFFAEHWRTAIDRMSQSGFCRGEGSRGWKASLDFLLQPDSVVRAMEGKYDNQKKNTQQPAFSMDSE